MIQRSHTVCLVLLLLFNLTCSGGNRAAETGDHAPLDAERAFSHVRQLVAFGPRAVGSEGHQRAREYIQSELKKLPLQVEVQSFTAITPRGSVKMHNIIARQTGNLKGNDSPVILLASHYDTFWTDRFSFVGANDGGSSTGLLLELARVLAPSQSDFQYWFVFFDGEEAIQQWSDLDSLYGSRELVRELRNTGQLSRVKTVILLDMIGDKDLNIQRDSYSTPWLVDLFWDTAANGKYSGFDSATVAILDDHIPFLQEGIPAIDLIDYDFGPGNSYWHTAEDSLDKISADSLRQAGEVVLKSLPALERALVEKEK